MLPLHVSAAKKAPSELVLEHELTLQRGEQGAVQYTMKIHNDMDASVGAFQCAVEHGLSADDAVEVHKQVHAKLGEGYAMTAGSDDLGGNAQAYADRAKSHRAKGDFWKAGHDFMRARALLPEDQAEARHALASELAMMLITVQDAELCIRQHKAGLHKEVMATNEKIDRLSDGSGKRHHNETILLAMAQSANALGDWFNVKQATGRLLRGASKRGTWKETQPRAVAVALGARAMLNMGDLGKAVDFWRIIIKADPDISCAKNE